MDADPDEARAVGPPARRRLLTRRRLLGAGLVGVAGAWGLRAGLLHWVRARPIRPLASLSEAARMLVAEAFADVDPAALWDSHAHVVGLGHGDSGCWISPRMRSYLHPFERLSFDVYLRATGMVEDADDDRAYVTRLVELQRACNPRGRLMLLAFDQHVDERGEVVPAASTFYTPNDWVFRIAAREPLVVPVASVHPYRKDALERLERVAAAGAVALKWLPNAMGIDPAAERCERFYRRLAELGLPLISHAGIEHAVHAADAQRLGNPLRLRRALDAGVRVVVAHCAGLGDDEDLDASGRPRRPSFELFLRLMRDERHAELLFGEISGMTLFNRCGDSLRAILAATELHPRLVNGSDYPLSAVRPLISPWLLARRGLIDPGERPLLAEIEDANPLLFDYVLKRRLRLEQGGRSVRFAPQVFESRRLFA